MQRGEAIARLRAHEAELRPPGMERVFLFGSAARGDARADSDVDRCFDHPKELIGLYQLMDLHEAASRIVGCTAAVVTRRSLHGAMRD